VIDTNKEDIAIQEAQRLNIPVAAIVDTNSSKGITYVVQAMTTPARHLAVLRSGRSRAMTHFARTGEAESTSCSAQRPARKSGGAQPPASRVCGAPRQRRRSQEVTACPARSRKVQRLGIFHYCSGELDHDTAHQIGEEVGFRSADGWVVRPRH